MFLNPPRFELIISEMQVLNIYQIVRPLRQRVEYCCIGHSAHHVENITEYWKSGQKQQPFAVIRNYEETYFDVVLIITYNKTPIRNKLQTLPLQCVTLRKKQ
jgi:hypothetical protein